MNKFGNLPFELENTESEIEDVNILVGKNGSGKSTLLNELSKHYLRNNKNVIAVANSIHDKFDSTHRRFKALRGRTGRRQTRATIIKSMMVIGEDKNKLRNTTLALEYVGFEPTIGFKLEKLNPENFNLIKDSELTEEEKERIFYLLNKSNQEIQFNEIIWLETVSFDFNSLEKTNLTELFKWESFLRKYKIIERIEVYLKKKDVIISMLDASSGELALITSIIYISTIINEETILLIDEPENSLHPLWQKEYTKILLDLFYLYQPKIIIATHSPLVVNGAEIFSSNSKIFKANNFIFEIQKQDPLNVEEIYYKFFDVTTPENRFLSNRLVRLLNLLAEKKMTLTEFTSELEKIKETTYDKKQNDALSKVMALAGQIVFNNQN